MARVLGSFTTLKKFKDYFWAHQNIRLIGFTAAITGIGMAAILFTQAATPSVGVETERGTSTGGASLVSGDATASGNGYVKFSGGGATGSPEFKGFYIFAGNLKNNYTYCKTDTKPCPVPDQIKIDERKFLEHPLAAGLGMAGSYWSKYQKKPSANFLDNEPGTGAFDWTNIDLNLEMLNTDAVKASNGGKPKNLILRTYIGQSRAPETATQPHDCTKTDDTEVDAAAGLGPNALIDQIPRFVFCPHLGPDGISRTGAKFFSWIDTDNQKSPGDPGYKYKAFIPIFWDGSFQADFADFRTALGEKVEGNENVMVALGGPYKAFEENFLPWSSSERSQWFQKYNTDFDPDIPTSSDDATAIRTIQDKYVAFMTSYLFPTNARAFKGNQPLIFALGLGAGDNNNSQNNSYNSFGRTNYGAFAVGSNSSNRGWSIQFNGLQPDITPKPTDGPGTAYVKKMINYIGQNWGPLSSDPTKRGIIGYQFVGGVLPFATSNIKIAQGGFRQSVQNAVNYKASYVEVYKSEFQAAYFYDTRNTTRIYNEMYDDNEKTQAQSIFQAMSDLQPYLSSTKP